MATGPDADIALSQIGQIAIPVRDIEAAVRFYRDALGLRFLFQAPPDLAFFDCAGVRLMLDGPARERAGHSSVIYFRVPDIGRAYSAFTARGVPFEGPPHLIARLPDHELWMAFFRDPDSNLLAIMSEVR
ncbi:MAG TPA: VOC family protein [Gemmatimonadales bacterium]|nr:VOC family protein [Gemmatimonadales bacterium]